MTISSPVFDNFEKIPGKYTCDGEGISPPLVISDIPEEAVTWVLLVDDPDAVNAGGDFAHWVLYDIDPQETEIEENDAPKSATSGSNSSGQLGYAAICPPEGETHNYRFVATALSEELNLPEGVGREQVLEAMKDVVIERAEIVGHYGR